MNWTSDGHAENETSSAETPPCERVLAMVFVKDHHKTAAETTDLERRVLAHERVLQALIAYMARTEPRFIDHLRERFVEPMSMARHEHDYRDADDYAEEFIRAVMLLGEARARKSKEPEAIGKRSVLPRHEEEEYSAGDRPGQRVRVQVRQRNGIWEVKADGKFCGDYVQKEQAIAAAALLRLALK
ncbi:hypothetical protein PXK05_19740 [Phaeobacter gallaeciensis]|uniref:hypothetical protein n=2 Tax=Phaeobacter gallaeciensis TaxID=60890 RepID=UPI00237FA514|nr:hypothetical protein [Phaeobacter gallaeciensis]MDE4230685.1 hypothetical protein [Phaeobacter gallaeciensis]MDE4268206.1 hypothetical protein [Phaeobacter gallaeciensis]